MMRPKPKPPWKVTRRKDLKLGGLTDQQKEFAAEWSQWWIDCAFQTYDPDIDLVLLRKSVDGLYTAAGLPVPRSVVLVPSPLVMALDATDAATLAATRVATAAATDAATRAATRAATEDATYAATHDATYAATRAATHAATYAATRAATRDANVMDWWRVYQGGNMWASIPSWISFCRDALGFTCAAHKPYAHWERLAECTGFRLMHPRFCLVTAPPVHVSRELHREDGPTHEWLDGFKIWHVNGVAVDEQIVMRPESQTARQILDEANEEVKRVRIERYGWARFLNDTNAKRIDSRRNDIEATREGLYRVDGHVVLLCACPSTAKVFALEVPPDTETCQQAQSFLSGGLDRRIISAS